ncbi:MAG: hypothetical protein NWR64_03105, partial [Haliea sp.]|nr:hypothetical protein [Haliea sp.]
TRTHGIDGLERRSFIVEQLISLQRLAALNYVFQLLEILMVDSQWQANPAQATGFAIYLVLLRA